MIYQGIDYKKKQKVKFVIPTDERIIDPKTKSIRWKYGSIEFFSTDKISAWVLEKKALKSQLKFHYFVYCLYINII